MVISFVKMEPYPCGCKVRFSDGNPEVSGTVKRPRALKRYGRIIERTKWNPKAI